MSIKHYNVIIPNHLAQQVAKAIVASGAKYLNSPYQNVNQDWVFSYEDGHTTAFRMAFIMTPEIKEVRKDSKFRRFIRSTFIYQFGTYIFGWEI